VRKCVENPVRTFPIKKSVNTELYIDRMAAFCKRETRIRDMTKEGDEADRKSKYTLRRNVILSLKGVGMKDQVSIYLEMNLVAKCEISRTLLLKYLKMK